MLERKSNWLYILCAIAILILLVGAFKKFVMREKKVENFTQDEDFIVKHKDTMYDTFYLEHYDDIMKSDERVQFEVSRIIHTNPSMRESVMLDVGCGTCKLLSALSTFGYRVYGLDKSPAVMQYASQKYPNLEIKEGDACSLMMYDKGLFTHITCMYFTIYEIDDKPTFLRNVHHWLQRGGYFIVHLVDKDKFYMVAPCAKVRNDLIQEHSNSRITDSKVLMPSYTYELSYKLLQTDVIVEETFTNANGQVRKNEKHMDFISKANIISMTEKMGFTLLDETNYATVTGDNHQCICIFQKH